MPAPFIFVTTHRISEGRLEEFTAVDGNPVVDIKSVMRQHLPAHLTQPAWVDLLLADYHRP